MWGLGPIALAACAPEFAYPATSDDGRTITVYAPWIAQALAWIAVVWFIALAVQWALTRGRRGLTGWALGATFVVALVAPCGNGMRLGLGPLWHGPQSEVTGDDGAEWTWFWRGFQDHDYAFARRASRRSLTTRWTVVTELWTTDDVGTRLVRPVGLEPADSLRVHNGRAALLNIDGTCIVAAALDGTPLIGCSDFGGTRRIPGETLPDGLPYAFLLIGPGDAVRTDDIDALVAAITAQSAESSPWMEGLPTDEGLCTALQSPRPDVRTAAERFARAGGAKLYPRAAERLAR